MCIRDRYCVVPVETLFPIREDIPLDEACIIPDAVSCMYHAIKDQGQVKKGDKILIYGAGDVYKRQVYPCGAALAP